MNTTQKTTETSRILLICGAIAGPLFVVTFFLEQAIHPGYSPLRNSISALALGSEYGWIQPVNFIIAGLLTMAFAVGVRRVVRSGRGAKSGPILIGLWALGLIVSGVFITDPDITYPPGTPYPVPVTTHGALHNLGAGIGVHSSSDSLPGVCPPVHRTQRTRLGLLFIAQWHSHLSWGHPCELRISPNRRYRPLWRNVPADLSRMCLVLADYACDLPAK
jgi:hypothetical protein